MTRLRAHYDAKLKAFVPDEPVDLPDGAQVTIRDPAEVESPRVERHPGYFIVGGPGPTGRELADRARKLRREGVELFPGDEDSVTVGRRLRDSD